MMMMISVFVYYSHSAINSIISVFESFNTGSNQHASSWYIYIATPRTKEWTIWFYKILSILQHQLKIRCRYKETHNYILNSHYFNFVQEHWQQDIGLDLYDLSCHKTKSPMISLRE